MMKNKSNWKKVILTVLLAAMGIQAAGCGGSKTDNTTAQKEFVYVPEYRSLDAQDGVDQVFINEDTIYYRSGSYNEAAQSYEEYLVMLKVGEDESQKIPLDFGEDSSIQQIAMDRDGSFLAVLSRYVYDEGKTGEAGEAAEEEEDAEGTEASEDAEVLEGTEVSEDVEVSEGAEVPEDGEASEDAEVPEDGEASEDAEVPEDGEASEDAKVPEDAETSEKKENSKEELSYEIVNEGGEGSHVYAGEGVGVAVASSADTGGWSEPSSRTMELCRFSQDGNILSKTDISDVFEDEESYVQILETDKDGNIYMCLYQSVVVLDKDGNEICEIKTEDWINEMFSTKDGAVYAVYYGNEGMETHLVDINAKAMGEAVKELMIGRYEGYTFAPGVDSDLVFSMGDNLYTYSFGDAAPAKVLNWVDCNIDRDDIRSFAVLEDGRIMVVLSSWDYESGISSAELAFLTKKKGSEVPEQKILTYGTLYLNYDIRKEIIDFNKKNQEYRIEVKEYVTNDSAEGYGSGVEQMNADMISGKGPDIIELSSANVQMYAAKGILEDLYPYIDADSEMNREDFLENIRKAYEIDGKLYTMPSRFYINTVLAKVSNVGERDSITLDELMEIAGGLPEGTQLYEYATKGSILMTNVVMNLDQYVDWSTGECKFNDGEFVKALEFANRFDTDYKEDTSGLTMPEKVQQNRLLMVQTGISSMQEYIMYEAMFGEPIAFCGYPTSSDNGSFISNAGSTMGINAKSPNKDGAWQFVRRSLTKEAQEGSSRGGDYGFPIMKSALEKQFEKDMTEDYYEDVDGTKKRSEKTSWGYDNFSVRIFAAKDYEVETVRKLIEGTDQMYQYDEKIMEIITEESNAYFEGQKSAKETADVIQNRIQVYVNENR
ncbi:MAG: extracellular solute-binding protein [Kineothrix sp.]|nr:extracellular solute-binding protein [Kineothrix sp.]